MKTKLMLAIFLTLCLSAATVLAQQWGDPNRLRNALEKTEELIVRAREVVQESGSERARNQLEMAVRLQKMARDMYGRFGILDETEWAMKSGKYTLSSREKAQRAIAITRQAAENEDYVRRRLEKTDDIIRRIEDRAGDDAPRGLRLMLDTAREKQQRAVEFFRNRRLKASLQITLQVEKSLKEAAEKAGNYRKAERRYQAQLDRYFTLRERIELGGYQDRPDVSRALENAERLHVKAGEAVSRNDNYGRAENTLQKAVKILTRVMENIREPMKVKAAIEDMEKVAEQVRAQVMQFGDEEIRRQYQNALEHMNKAKAMYSQGRYEESAVQVRAAHQIMNRVAKIVEEPVKVEHGLELLRGMAAKLDEKVNASGDRLLQKEMTQVQEYLSRAAALYRAGDYNAASVQLEMAERTMARISHSLGE